MVAFDAPLVRRALDQGALRTVFQPVFSLTTGEVTSLEALTRFTVGAGGSPSGWFREAHAEGLGVELELAALRCALRTATALPEHVALAVNLSPAALIDRRVVLELTHRHVARLVVEVTEQAPLRGQAEVLCQREKLRRMGVRVAVDDVVATRASLRHLARLRPDVVKADLSLTARLETGRRARMLAAALVAVARRRGATVVAEGVESPGQLARWQRLGADAAQGFLLATPSSLGEALAAGHIAVA